MEGESTQGVALSHASSGVDATLTIIDAHQHFWNPGPNYYPWLCDEPPIPFRHGDYRPIRRRYLPPDYRADAAPFHVEKSVYVVLKEMLPYHLPLGATLLLITYIPGLTTWIPRLAVGP